MKSEQTKQWYLMASGTMFMAYVANLGAKILKVNKPMVTLVTFVGLLAGASITARMLDNQVV